MLHFHVKEYHHHWHKSLFNKKFTLNSILYWNRADFIFFPWSMGFKLAWELIHKFQTYSMSGGRKKKRLLHFMRMEARDVRYYTYHASIPDEEETFQLNFLCFLLSPTILRNSIGKLPTQWECKFDVIIMECVWWNKVKWGRRSLWKNFVL